MKESKRKNWDECWLRYEKIEDARLRKKLIRLCGEIILTDDSLLARTAGEELRKGILGMLGVRIGACGIPGHTAEIDGKRGCIFIGTSGSALSASDGFPETVRKIFAESATRLTSPDGFILRTLDIPGGNSILVVAAQGKGVLYGVHELLRRMRSEETADGLNVMENPTAELRIIDHWDNLDGSIERGYAGKSIFFRNGRVVRSLKRIEAYARLLSSVGINGVVLNNVNVRERETLLITPEYLGAVARIASVFRMYGIRIFLSVNFASPIRIGNLQTADPLDSGVRLWWIEKAAEIYTYIKDFGGFLVKADSEFNPGPYVYGRTHAEGANMLASALEPFGGTVIWRCFVYNCLQDWRDRSTDRAKAAYEFRSARRYVQRECDAPDKERSDGLSGSRACVAVIRRDGKNESMSGTADYAGIYRAADSPLLSRPVVERNTFVRYLRTRKGGPGVENRRRQPFQAQELRDGGCRERGRRPVLDGASSCAGESLRFRQTCLELASES